VTTVESRKILDAAGHSRIGCSSEPGEDDTERLRDDQEQASRAARFDYVSKIQSQGSPEGGDSERIGEGDERRAAVLKLGMRDGGIRHPSKNRTHVP
jgi:hypothetical protein